MSDLFRAKVRSGGTVHSDRDTGWSQFSWVGVAQLVDSGRRKANFVIRIGPRDMWPITKAVPTVQPECRESQMSNL